MHFKSVGQFASTVGKNNILHLHKSVLASQWSFSTSSLQELMAGWEVNEVNIFITQVSDNPVSADLSALVDVIWSTPPCSMEIVWVCCCLIPNFNSLWNFPKPSPKRILVSTVPETFSIIRDFKTTA